MMSELTLREVNAKIGDATLQINKILIDLQTELGTKVFVHPNYGKYGQRNVLLKVPLYGTVETSYGQAAQLTPRD